MSEIDNIKKVIKEGERTGSSSWIEGADPHADVPTPGPRQDFYRQEEAHEPSIPEGYVERADGDGYELAPGYELDLKTRKPIKIKS